MLKKQDVYTASLAETWKSGFQLNCFPCISLNLGIVLVWNGITIRVSPNGFLGINADKCGYRLIRFLTKKKKSFNAVEELLSAGFSYHGVVSQPGFQIQVDK